MKNKKISLKVSVACALLLSASYLVVAAPLSAKEAGYTGDRDTENRFHGWGVYTYLAGGKYEGEWQYGQKDGVGRRDWPDGSRYEGEWSNNQPHGKGIKTYKGGAQYTGDFRQGLRAGKGTMRWTNGMEYSGEWKNDQMEGEGSKRFADNTQYDGHFSKGVRSGWGTYIFADKTRYEGNWAHDMQEGKGTLLFPDGGVYKGDFKQGQPHGNGELTYANGDHYSGQWEKGTLSGKGMLRYAQGGSYNGQWKNGLRNGKGEWVSASGSIYSGPFVNDKPHGRGNCAENGSSAPCFYEYGRRQNDTRAQVAAVTQPAAVAASVAAPMAAATHVAVTSAQVASATTVTNAASTTTSEASATSASTDAAAQTFKSNLAVAKQKIALTPSEQLNKVGSGMYFSHSFEKLALAQPPSFSWWSKNTALFSDNLKMTLMRGRDQLEITVHSYKGPGNYTGDQYEVALLKDGRTYQLQESAGDSIQIEEENNGWISGRFSATLLDTQAMSEPASKLEQGVFRLSNKRPDAATALNDATTPRKPLLEAAMPLVKGIPIIGEFVP